MTLNKPLTDAGSRRGGDKVSHLVEAGNDIIVSMISDIMTSSSIHDS